MEMNGFFLFLSSEIQNRTGVCCFNIFIYLAAALKPTDIMNTHPVSVMLQRPPRAEN